MLAPIEKFIYDHLHPRVVALEARVAELEARVKEFLDKKLNPEPPASGTHPEKQV
jgi:hypothetical protein